MVQGLDPLSEGKLPQGFNRTAYRIQRQERLIGERLRVAAALGFSSFQLVKPIIQRGRVALLTPYGCLRTTFRLAAFEPSCHITGWITSVGARLVTFSSFTIRRWNGKLGGVMLWSEFWESESKNWAFWSACPRGKALGSLWVFRCLDCCFYWSYETWEAGIRG